MSCVDNDDECVICTSVQTVHLSAHNSLAAVEMKIELDSHEIHMLYVAIV